MSKKKRQDLEHKIQAKFIGIIRSYFEQYPLLELIYAVPNGGYRSMSEAIKIKAEGGKSGVPDVVLPIPNGIYASLYLEFKTEKGVVSSNQKNYIKLLKDAKNSVKVVRSAESALKAVEEHTGYSLPYFNIEQGVPVGWC